MQCACCVYYMPTVSLESRRKQPCWRINGYVVIKYLTIILIQRELQDVVYFGWPIAPSYTSTNAGGGGLRGLSQWVYLCTWARRRSNSIFNPFPSSFRGIFNDDDISVSSPFLWTVLFFIQMSCWKTYPKSTLIKLTDILSIICTWLFYDLINSKWFQNVFNILKIKKIAIHRWFMIRTVTNWLIYYK